MLDKKTDYVFVSQEAMEHIAIKGEVYPTREGRMTLFGEDVAFLTEGMAMRNSIKSESDGDPSTDVILYENNKFADGFYKIGLNLIGQYNNYNWAKPDATLKKAGVVFNISGEYDSSKISEARQQIATIKNDAKDSINDSWDEYQKYLNGYTDDKKEWHEGELYRHKQEVTKITTDKNRAIWELQDEHRYDEYNLCSQFQTDCRNENNTHSNTVREINRKYEKKEIEEKEYYKQIGEEDIRHYDELRKLYRTVQKNVRDARDSLNKQIWQLQSDAFYQEKGVIEAEIEKLLDKDDSYRSTWQSTMRTAASECYSKAQGAVYTGYAIPTGSTGSFNAMNATPKQISLFDELKNNKICASCASEWYARGNSALALSFDNSLSPCATSFISFPSSDATNGVFADLDRMTQYQKDSMYAYHSACKIKSSGTYDWSYNVLPGDIRPRSGGINPIYGTCYEIYEAKNDEDDEKETQTLSPVGCEVYVHIGTRLNVDEIDKIDVLLMEGEGETCETWSWEDVDVWVKDGDKYKVIEGRESIASSLLSNANMYQPVNPWTGEIINPYTNEDPPYVRDGGTLEKGHIRKDYKRQDRKTYSIEKYSLEDDGIRPSDILDKLDACDEKYKNLLAENEKNRAIDNKKENDNYYNEIAGKNEEYNKDIESLSETRDKTIATAWRTMWNSLFPVLPGYNKQIKDGEKTYSDFDKAYVQPGKRQVETTRLAAEATYGTEKEKLDSALSTWNKEHDKTHQETLKTIKKKYDELATEINKKWKAGGSEPKEGEEDKRGERTKIIAEYNKKWTEAEDEYNDTVTQAERTFNNAQWKNVAEAESKCNDINPDFRIGCSTDALPWFVLYIEGGPEDPPKEDYDRIVNVLNDCNSKNEQLYKTYSETCDAAEEKYYAAVKNLTKLREGQRSRWKFTPSASASAQFKMADCGSHSVKHWWEGIIAAYVTYKPNTKTGADFEKLYKHADSLYRIRDY